MKKIILLFFISSKILLGQIAVDGIYTDWNSEDLLISDEGDHSGLDIEAIYVSNDAENLYIRIDTDREFDIQESEDIRILIDADNDPNTGFNTDGIGSEISYYFGNRGGFLNYTDDFLQTNHATLGVIAAPTITSSTFEIVFKRKPISSLGTIEMANTISISISNGSNGDKVPNENGGIQYTMNENEKFSIPFSYTKVNPTHTRILTYNIERDGFLENDNKPHLESVIKALNPDIIALQEVYDTPLSSIGSFLDSALPIEGGKNWQYSKVNPDIAIFTKGIVEASDKIDGNGVFLLYDKTGENPLIIYNVHLPCCDNDESRQLEIDRILSVLRDKENSSEINFSYPENTPIIITGDFNMVGKSQNLKSFLEGDIENEATFGADFGPDWDGSNLEDANPYITGFPANYTWRNNNSSYNPGKLDFIFYTGSVMNQHNGFVLSTEFLSDSVLDSLGLNKNSTALASDHLPVVVDFSFGIIDDDMDGFASDIDCDDDNADINPEAEEIANNEIDENCDGVLLLIDEDMDGFNSNVDCDDSNAAINPGALEIPNNEVDENCDGVLIAVDVDMDGFNSDVDCNDSDASINPDAEEIANNEIDENCDGIILVIDEDMDGYNSDVDCDDSNAAIHPEMEEVPNNGIDENCDGEDLISSLKSVSFKDLEIYPNPTSDFLMVNTNLEKVFSLEIYQMDGKLIRGSETFFKQTILNVNPLKEGAYLLRLIDLNGESFTSVFLKNN